MGRKPKQPEIPVTVKYLLTTESLTELVRGCQLGSQLARLWAQDLMTPKIREGDRTELLDLLEEIAQQFRLILEQFDLKGTPKYAIAHDCSQFCKDRESRAANLGDGRSAELFVSAGGELLLPWETPNGDARAERAARRDDSGAKGQQLV